MTKTIENKCEHSVIKFIDTKKDTEGKDYPLAKCYYCCRGVVVTDKYRLINGKVYELKGMGK